jgi:hypothetical protein
MFVKPAEGIRVRDPVSRFHIPATGVEVPENQFWTRRLLDGDVVRADPPALAQAVAPTPEPAEAPAPKAQTQIKKGKE